MDHQRAALSRLTPLAACAVLLVSITAASAEALGTRVDIPVRGRTMAVTIYRPAVSQAEVKGTVLMGSGDVGWVGLAVSMSEFLEQRGYLVVGINARQYVSAFTSKTSHLTPDDVAHDYEALMRALAATVKRPTYVSGVSEGAGLAVLAAASSENHSWIDGVITVGLPRSAELAWRWSDFTSWITKKDAAEPSFDPRSYLASVAPLPLVMIQSRKDEYVTEADYRSLAAAAQPPKKQVLIDASNHRFTDRIPELRDAFVAALAWILSSKPVS